MLTDLYVIDKESGEIHRIGDNPHDSFWVSSDGVLHYQNVQNMDGCAGDGYKNAEGYGYAFLPQDVTMPMAYEHFDQPETCLRDMKSKCSYPITDCANCPKRQLHVVKRYEHRPANNQTAKGTDTAERIGNMLILPIKKKWFDMILSGEKKEEYREVKPYYMSRFKNVFYMTPYSFIPAGNEHKQIMFRNGYSKNSPSFIAECSLDINKGKMEWGADEGVDYYILTIHKIVWKSMDNLGGYLKILKEKKE